MKLKIYIFSILSLFIGLTHSAKFERNFIQDIENDHSTAAGFLNFGSKKLIKSRINKLENSVIKSKIDVISGVFKKSTNRLKSKNKKIDVVFLIDSSSSVGKNNFMSEIKFVKKLLSDFTVSFNDTRVAIVTFSSQGRVVSKICLNYSYYKSEGKWVYVFAKIRFR